MLNFLAPAALSLAQAAAVGQPLPDLSLEQASALRCSVAFGMVHSRQVRGEPAAAQYPAMAERGREFFVRTTARLMDDLKTNREAIAGLVARETDELSTTPERVDEVMPACLLMLDASGL
ncbi:hypothetical protein [Qipengyuania qiaonensis]|uniref:Uncharacterized protein n=1 Tax=Qipengyuania qiaonensis TaxID=2867240 RepID=A0ABS7JAG5_9SPHN|nr:hypothetical protein [Qipengyuania qiaonensis]MBX7481977.1 hypothetical protein [Qipengyuania qiaonensis]